MDNRINSGSIGILRDLLPFYETIRGLVHGIRNQKTLYGAYKEFGAKNVELLRFGKKKIFFLECSYSYFCASNIIIFMLRSVVGRDLDPKPTDSDSKLNKNRV